MLNLPIRSRAPSGSLPPPGAPPPENVASPNDAAEEPGSPEDKMSSSGSMKVTVKNTFIDLEEEEQTPLAAKAATCTARLSGTIPVLFTPEATPSAATSAPADLGFISEEIQETVGDSPDPTPFPELPEASVTLPFSAALSDLPASVQAGEPRFSIKNTFIEVEDTEGTARSSRYTQSCTAAMLTVPDTFNLDSIRAASQAAQPVLEPTEVIIHGSHPSASSARLPTPTMASMETHLEEPVSDAPKQSTLSLTSFAPPPEVGDLKFTVKNTFIDFPDGEETPLHLDRFAQSCTARMSGPPPMLFPPTPQKVGAMGSISDMGSLMESLPEGDEVPVTSTLPDPLRLTVRDGAVTDEPSTSPMRATQSPGAIVSPTRSSPKSPAPPPPPAYAAPEVQELGSQSMPPPPLASAETVDMNSWAPTSPHAGFSMAGYPASLSGTESAGLGYSMPAPVALHIPSMGSQLHGTFGADGQPACKPCAWFYKEGSCLNASACGYCHLCPQGELKNRKKAKIATLRRLEAAQAAAEGASSPVAAAEPAAHAQGKHSTSGGASPGSNKSAGGPKKVFLLSSFLPS